MTELMSVLFLPLTSCCCFMLFIFETGPHCGPGCPGTMSLDHVGFKLTELRLPLPQKYWDYTCVTLLWARVVILKAWDKLGMLLHVWSPSPQRLIQEDYEFEASLLDIARPCLKRQNQNLRRKKHEIKTLEFAHDLIGKLRGLIMEKQHCRQPEPGL